MWKKVWYFVWKDNSFWSWIVNIILAFILVKFVIYPVAGFILNTDYPIVAVMSNSMRHNGDFDEWWSKKGSWYSDRKFNKEEVKAWSFSNGFNKGDIMILRGKEDVKIGDVVVYKVGRKEPIIHRVIKKWDENGVSFLQTKGDNNIDVLSFEKKLKEQDIVGVAVLRIPMLGWIKIIFVELVNAIR